MTTETVRKWGNSLAVRLPHEVASRVNLEDGVQIEMVVTESNEVILRPTHPSADDQENLRRHFLALRANCTPGTANHAEAFSDPMGDEII